MVTILPSTINNILKKYYLVMHEFWDFGNPDLLVGSVVAVLAAVELLDLVAVLLPDVVDHGGL